MVVLARERGGLAVFGVVEESGQARRGRHGVPCPRWPDGWLPRSRATRPRPCLLPGRPPRGLHQPPALPRQVTPRRVLCSPAALKLYPTSASKSGHSATNPRSTSRKLIAGNGGMSCNNCTEWRHVVQEIMRFLKADSPFMNRTPLRLQDVKH